MMYLLFFPCSMLVSFGTIQFVSLQITFFLCPALTPCLLQVTHREQVSSRYEYTIDKISDEQTDLVDKSS
jgi:hypothetical protein